MEHFLSADDWSTERISGFMEKAASMAKREPSDRSHSDLMTGRILANLFYEPSTRTRLSFGAAFMRLDGKVLDTANMQFSSMAKGESLQDTARVVSGYADVITIRHPERGSAAQFAEGATVPVINAGDGDGEHPTQALLDVYTIKDEIGRLDNLHVAVVGDLRFGRTVHSLLRMLGRFDDITVSAVAPSALQLPDQLVEELQQRMSIEQTEDMDAVLPHADIVYMTRTQIERHPSFMRPDITTEFAFTADKLTLCRPEARILHPLPRDSAGGQCELDPSADHDPRITIFRQADNGVPVRMALFAELLR